MVIIVDIGLFLVYARNIAGCCQELDWKNYRQNKTFKKCVLIRLETRPPRYAGTPSFEVWIFQRSTRWRGPGGEIEIRLS
jgi:hypothetical protein